MYLHLQIEYILFFTFIWYGKIIDIQHIAFFLCCSSLVCLYFLAVVKRCPVVSHICCSSTLLLYIYICPLLEYREWLVWKPSIPGFHMEGPRFHSIYDDLLLAINSVWPDFPKVSDEMLRSLRCMSWYIFLIHSIHAFISINNILNNYLF